MKANDLNRAFLLEWGLPFIRREFPGLEDHVAVGCFEGSQAIGADDHLSHDHGWGPRFELIIDDDYDVSDEEVVEQLCEAAPSEFRGYRRLGGYDTAVSSTRCSAFFERSFGCLPERDKDWVRQSTHLDGIESWLYLLKHGPVFYDGSGCFSELRQRYSGYPEAVMLLRMSQCAWQIFHYGEYNFCGRLAERGDQIPMSIAVGYFTEAVLRMYFYLDGDFAPYWKWLAFEFKKRRFCADTERGLETLHQKNPSEQAREISSICERLRRTMIERNVVPNNMDNPYGVPWFFLISEHLKGRIADNTIREL